MGEYRELVPIDKPPLSSGDQPRDHRHDDCSSATPSREGGSRRTIMGSPVLEMLLAILIGQPWKAKSFPGDCICKAQLTFSAVS